MRFEPWPYQAYTTQRIIDGTCGPLLDMGLGKTVATLTAIEELIYKRREVKKVLVIAPLLIADQVWTAEINKWDHLKHLRVSKILGSERKRKEALLRKADIYIINRENVAWLVGFYGRGFPYDMAVVDESSSFKNPDSQRFKALRQVAPLIKRKYILTGTPIPNGLLGLWSQVYILDRGKRLGDSYKVYQKSYFIPNKRDSNRVFSYKLMQPEKKNEDLFGSDIYERIIHEKIEDICFSMKAEDYLQLPKRIDRIREVQLSDKAFRMYEEFEREQVLALDQEEEITALSAAALCTKLLQFSNGAVYDSDKKYHVVHNDKLDALEEIVEGADGHPVLIFYSYQHDLERIRKRFATYEFMTMKDPGAIDDWNSGKVEVMAAHPASAGHGLNLQAGGNIIVWFGIPWSLELYQQANARLHRQGQQKPVIIHHLVTAGTMDVDVMEALAGKANKQDALMRAVKARIEKYK